MKYVVYNSRVVISHTLVKIILNVTDFTNFFLTKMLTSLFLFSSANNFWSTLLLKIRAVQARKLLSISRKNTLYVLGDTT